MEAWKTYCGLKEQLTTQIQAFTTDHFPKAVLDFCIAAQSEGARLDMLTDEVRDWFEANKMLDSLRYRLK